MDQSLFLILLFSGLSILPSSLPHQFHFVNMTKTWTEAQRFCRQNYTDLATIDDMADMKKLNSTVSASWRGSAWIGLYNIIWRWSLGDRELEGEVFWDDHHPNHDTETFCVYMLLNATWQNFNCSKTFYFICYDGEFPCQFPHQSTMLSNTKSFYSDKRYILFSFFLLLTSLHLYLYFVISYLFQIEKNATNKYILIAEYKTWSDAQLYCQEKHTDLASVRNTTERDAIKSILPNVTDIYRMWIGLNKSSGVWRWSDQSGFSFKSWETYKENNADGSYQNGEFCGEVTFPSGKWNYQGCTNNTHFICYDDELVLVTENKTWSEALWHCRDLDMELVSAHNQRIQHWVQQRAKKASTPFVWLGLRYTCTLDFWFWVNGEESCYHNWADGEGYNTSKEQCGNTGAIQRDGGQWVGKAETERFNFICSKSDDY